jgi:molybdopterin synthase catalytic subunit
MQVNLFSFGVLRDSVGTSTLELRDGETVADLLVRVADRHPGVRLQGIAVSVNAEYAQGSQVLVDGDEVGLLPPVSGGTDEAEVTAVVTALTHDVIRAEKLVEEAKRGEDGAVVVFDGIVRNHSRGRRTLHLAYEAYEEMALKQIDGLAREAVARFGVRHVTLIHRLGRLAVGETSVLIIVASAHRAQAYEASRWLIDTLKKTVPIWKKETFVDGVVWADGEPFPEGVAALSEEAPRA